MNGLKAMSAISRTEGPRVLVIASSNGKVKIGTMPSSLSMLPEQDQVTEDAPAGQIDEIVRSFFKLFTTVGSAVLEWAWCELIVQAGWLPHISIPPELIADARDVEDADLRLGNFFRANWPQISESLRRSVRASDVDVDAREAFDECVRAHALGLYRVAPALLFPHIERVARDALLPNAMGASATSLLFEAVGELGPSEFTMPGVSGVRLYSKLAGHLYKQVRTPDEVEAARLDPVPNRHARSRRSSALRHTTCR